MKFLIFTDGASKGNPGPGGWGAIVSDEVLVVELGGRESHATNNQMELRGVIEALASVQQKQVDGVTVYSDSSYVLNGIEKWIHAWKKKGWKTMAGEPVQNKDLWQRLDSLVQELGIKISWNYLGGHVGIAGNERVDEIASNFAEGERINLYSGPVSGYTINILNFESDQLKQSAKSSSKNHSKAKAYSYVSLVDGSIKTHKTWAECEARVKNKKARFKKATSPGEEKAIIADFGK
jgi:ribonuclease HI